ncbi:MAG: hypothetical protein ACI8QS_001071 [Planctomycetota bacterium]|jgi:hypothetical protein
MPVRLLAFLLIPLLIGAASGVQVSAGQAGKDQSSTGQSSGEQSTALRSYLSTPLYLGDQPPECRTLEILHLAFGEGAQRTREEALDLARRIAPEAVDATRFRALAKQYSQAPNADFGAVLGTFPPGVLGAEFEEFLWSAKIGDVSVPLEREAAIFLLRRGERWAGCRLILIKDGAGAGSERLEQVSRRLGAGESVASLARELSEEQKSSARGGDYLVFERGSQDRLLKRALFEAKEGAVIGPLATPLGTVFAQRAAPSELASSLWESNWARARSILISHRDAPGPIELNARSFSEALELAGTLANRLRTEDEQMESLAKLHDDDLDGRLRAGDLGWIRRGSPTSREVLQRVFQVQPGTLIGPLPLQVGYLLLERSEP